MSTAPYARVTNPFMRLTWSSQDLPFISDFMLCQVLPELVEKENIEALSGFFLKRSEGELTSADIAVLVASLQIRFYESLRDSYGALPNAESAMIRFHTVSHLVCYSQMNHFQTFSQFMVQHSAVGGFNPIPFCLCGTDLTVFTQLQNTIASKCTNAYSCHNSQSSMRSSLCIAHSLDVSRTGCSAEATVKISFFPYTNFMHQGRQDYTVQQAQIAFVEMWLLSFSDVLLTSPYSTFGYIPQGNVIITRTDFLHTQCESSCWCIQHPSFYLEGAFPVGCLVASAEFLSLLATLLVSKYKLETSM